jgi:hypothetical protein
MIQEAILRYATKRPKATFLVMIHYSMMLKIFLVMSSKQVYALSGLVILAIIGGGTLAYRASVHEQICLSYERQLSAQLDAMTAIAEKASDMKKAVSANPFAGLAILGEIMPLVNQINSKKAEMNNTAYALKGTCGEGRTKKIAKDLKPKYDHLMTVTSVLSSQ